VRSSRASRWGVISTRTNSALQEQPSRPIHESQNGRRHPKTRAPPHRPKAPRPPDRDCPLQGGGGGGGGGRGGGRGAPAMPEPEAAGLSAMRGSGARGNPNRAYRRYTAIPLTDYIVCGCESELLARQLGLSSLRQSSGTGTPQPGYRHTATRPLKPHACPLAAISKPRPTALPSPPVSHEGEGHGGHDGCGAYFRRPTERRQRAQSAHEGRVSFKECPRRRKVVVVHSPLVGCASASPTLA
jgi:hypothetical protein